MPITPKFYITQDDDHVYIKVNIPHVRITSLEIIAEGFDFSFYCKPYLLKLSFPFEVNGEDDKCKGVYDPDTEDGIVNITIPKRIKGQYFPNLDLLTTLLFKAPSRQRIVKDASFVNNAIPKIQVLTESNDDEDDDDDEEVNDDDKLCEQLSAAYDHDDDNINLNLPSNNNSKIGFPTYSYGFRNQYHGMLSHLSELLSDVIELPSPDTISYEIRHQLRLVSEIQLFDASRYLGDYFHGMEDVLYIEAKQYQPFYCVDYAKGVLLNKQKVQQNDKMKALPVNTDSSGVNNHGVTDVNKSTTTVDGTTNIVSSDHNLAAFFTDDENDVLVNQLKPNLFNTTSAISLLSASSSLLATSIQPTPSSLLLLQSANNISSSSLSSADMTERSLLLNLVDIMFSICYEYRLAGGDYNVESCANVTWLSAVLSWFDHHQDRGSGDSGECSSDNNNGSNGSQKLIGNKSNDILSVLYSCCRRSFVYPYLRYRKYFLKVLTDMAKVFILGQKYLLKLLLGLKKIYDKTHTYYILNRLYINDYCVWIQHISNDVIMSFAKELNQQITDFIQMQLFESDTSQQNVATILSTDNWLDVHIRKLEMWANKTQTQQQLELVEESQDNVEDESDSDDDEEEADDDDDTSGMDTSMPTEYTIEGRLHDFHDFLASQSLLLQIGNNVSSISSGDNNGGSDNSGDVLQLNQLISEISVKSSDDVGNVV